MACVCKVSPYKTTPARAICGDDSRLCSVNGILVGMDLELCARHQRQLKRLGLAVEPCVPLVQAASRAEAQRAAGLRTIAKPGEPGFMAPRDPELDRAIDTFQEKPVVA